MLTNLIVIIIYNYPIIKFRNRTNITSMDKQEEEKKKYFTLPIKSMLILSVYFKT
jgi:septation ring formation regulator EzrA